MKKHLIFIGLSSLFIATAQAERERWNKNYVWQAPKIWQEADYQIPEFIESNQWLTIDLGARAPFSARVMRESVKVGTDGVVRYALNITMPSGAENLSLQALRCETAEYRNVAIGRVAEKKWIASQSPVWRRITDAQLTQATLFRDYFCDGAQLLNEEEILKNFGLSKSEAAHSSK